MMGPAWTLSRRAAIQVLAGLLLVPEKAFALIAPRREDRLPDEMERILRVFASEPRLRQVGARYLERSDGRAQARAFMRSLCRPRGQSGEVSAPDLLRARIRKDFQEESVIVVDGWRLARTEVFLCAAAVLRDRRGS